MTAAKDVVTQTILLLTDDANAIAEANAVYPNHTWVTIQRLRFQAAQGCEITRVACELIVSLI
jgi:hypothetical protein